MMLAVIHHYKVYNILHNETGFYIERHIFLDKIYISSKQDVREKLEITSVKKTKHSIIIETNSRAGFVQVDLNYIPQVEYKTTSKYLHIPSNKKVIVLDNYGNEMHEYK